MRKPIYSGLLIVALLLLSGCHKKLSYYEVNCTRHTYFRIQYAHTKAVDKEINDVVETYYNSLPALTNVFVANEVLCDLLSVHFDGKGIDNYIINIGGKIVMKGINRYQRPWVVSIPTPHDIHSRHAFHYASCQEKRAIVTAGDHRHTHASFRSTEDKPMLSVTVVADDCKRANALSAAILFMPRDTFESNKHRLNCSEYLLVYAGETDPYTIETSEGIQRHANTPHQLVALGPDPVNAYDLEFQTEPLLLPFAMVSLNPMLPPSR